MHDPAMLTAIFKSEDDDYSVDDVVKRFLRYVRENIPNLPEPEVISNTYTGTIVIKWKDEDKYLLAEFTPDKSVQYSYMLSSTSGVGCSSMDYAIHYICGLLEMFAHDEPEP